ncbi:MAG: S1 family peptidase [Bacillota bacterium]
MSKRLALTGLLLLALVLAPSGCGSPQAVTAPPDKPTFEPVAIYERAAPATWTVLVNTVDGWWAKGSAFSVNSPGNILTAYHVVKDYKEFRLVDWDGDTTYTATVKRFDAKADLALLEIANPSNTAYLGLAPEGPKVGEDVALISSPKTDSKDPISAAPSALTIGRVALVVGGRLLVDVTAGPGSSGGAVLNARGEVVGMTLSMADTGISLHSAIPASALPAFLSGR